MSAPDFYFVNNAIFRHLHDVHGKDALILYWTRLGAEYYRSRTAAWAAGGPAAIAADWRAYFLLEPRASVTVTHVPPTPNAPESVLLDVHDCPAIRHLRDNGRDIVPYFCEHCDHVCSAMAAPAGYRFERTGGMGACHQRFVRLSVSLPHPHPDTLAPAEG